ncbi:MAG: LytR C-terminal domain-containing protein [Elusimicrobia bacterium]|nr:LytR C-terminal domain-containing protein [Elusimicrobiota bacterium]
MRSLNSWARPVELALVVVGLSVAVALGALERRSGLAASLRAGAPVVARLSFRGETRGSSFVLVYHPSSRTLDIADLAGKPLTAADPDGVLPPPAFEASVDVLGEAPADALAVRRLLDSWPRGLRFWWEAARPSRQGALAGTSAYDRALIALEAYRLAPGSVRPVWPPASAYRRELWASLLRDAPASADPAQIRVEVLNGSGESGLALSATKALRWHQVDVIDYGNADDHGETHLVDRAGRPSDARRVAELLGCPDADVWTQYDPSATAPVALVLGRDFRRCRRL